MAFIRLRKIVWLKLLLVICFLLVCCLVSESWLTEIQNGLRHRVGGRMYGYSSGSLASRIRSGWANKPKLGKLSAELLEASTVADEVALTGTSDNVSLETYERSFPSLPDPEGGQSATLHCNNLFRPVMTAENGSTIRMRAIVPDRWQPIRENASYVFSAHRDPRYADRIRIRAFGVMATDVIRDPVKGRLFCQIWNSTRFVAVRSSTVQVLSLNNTYSSFMLICDFDSELALNHTHFLAVTKLPCIRPTNALHVNDNGRISSPYHRFAACLTTALGPEFADHRRLIEWLELTTILGSKKTTIYASEPSQNTLKVFAYYERRHSVTIVPWAEPSPPDSGRAARAVLVNDCLYRNLGRTVHLAELALDETLAPVRRHLYDWGDVIGCACCPNVSYVTAMRANFDPRRPDDVRYRHSEFIAARTRLLTLLKTDRRREPRDADVGSGGLMVTSMIDSLAAGRVEFVFGIYLEPCVVPECIALLYTYRELDDVNGNEKTTAEAATDRITDTRLHKYSSLLTTAVSIVHRELRKEFGYSVA